MTWSSIDYIRKRKWRKKLYHSRKMSNLLHYTTSGYHRRSGGQNSTSCESDSPCSIYCALKRHFETSARSEPIHPSYVILSQVLRFDVLYFHCIEVEKRIELGRARNFMSMLALGMQNFIENRMERAHHRRLSS